MCQTCSGFRRLTPAAERGKKCLQPIPNCASHTPLHYRVSHNPLNHVYVQIHEPLPRRLWTYCVDLDPAQRGIYGHVYARVFDGHFLFHRFTPIAFSYSMSPLYQSETRLSLSRTSDFIIGLLSDLSSCLLSMLACFCRQSRSAAAFSFCRRCPHIIQIKTNGAKTPARKPPSTFNSPSPLRKGPVLTIFQSQ